MHINERPYYLNQLNQRDQNKVKFAVTRMRKALDGLELPAAEDANWERSVAAELAILVLRARKPEEHVYVGTGYCAVCFHYGQDCVGKLGRKEGN